MNQPIEKKAKEKRASKEEIIKEIAEALDYPKTEVRRFFDVLKQVMMKHLEPGGSGYFKVPNLQLVVQRLEQAARPVRQARNPQTGQAIQLPARPACSVIKAATTRALRDAFKPEE